MVERPSPVMCMTAAIRRKTGASAWARPAGTTDGRCCTAVSDEVLSGNSRACLDVARRWIRHPILHVERHGGRAPSKGGLNLDETGDAFASAKVRHAPRYIQVGAGGRRNCLEQLRVTAVQRFRPVAADL